MAFEVSHCFRLLIYKGRDKAFSCVEFEPTLCFGLPEILNSVCHLCRQAGQENFCTHMWWGRWGFEVEDLFFPHLRGYCLCGICFERALGVTNIFAKHMYTPAHTHALITSIS